jgi:hypothetical protein
MNCPKAAVELALNLESAFSVRNQPLITDQLRRPINTDPQINGV